MLLEEQLPLLYARRRFGIKPGVERVVEMLERLGNPHRSFRTIHVVGTNGKGSTASFLASILSASNHCTALFTSPHLVRFNERFRINGHEISDQRLSDLIASVLSVASEESTFFEIVTAMAALYFAEETVDVAIMEAGMGGRSDATAAFHGVATLMTPVSLDHTDYLGATVRDIATEKIAIAPPETRLIIGKQSDDVHAAVASWCDEHAFTPVLLDTCVNSHWNDDGTFDYHGIAKTLTSFTSGIGGHYQLENASLALLAAECLQRDGWSIPEEALRIGIAQANWPGRMELVPGKPAIMLDGAHNTAGMKALAQSLSESKKYGRLLIVLGIMADKDVAAMVSYLPDSAVCYCVAPNIERAMDDTALKDMLASYGRMAFACGSVAAGIERAQQDAEHDDLIVVCGSLFTVGEAKALFEGKIFEGIRG